jgi:hypothetical protein
LAKFGIRYGKSLFKFLKKILKKAKPKKGGPKPTKIDPIPTKMDPKATKGVADAASTSVSQESLGTGGKILSNVW